MDKDNLKKIQDTELKILEAVTDLCEKHGITYFLDSGTLLGAIRHNGFIPWDDDVDIAMPYKDYKHFLEIAQDELGPDYFIQNYETSDQFYRSYTKVNLNGTTVLPRDWEYWNIHHGAWIDVFPMFYSDSDRDIRKKRRLYKISTILQEKNYYYSCMKHSKPTLRTVFTYSILSLIDLLPIKSRKKLHKSLLDRVFSKQDGKYICRCGLFVWKYDKSDFMEIDCYHKFEHLSLRIPSEYEKILHHDYGDYMQLPPEDKRGVHGEITVVINSK
ncbi:MAG: LicD family protein [Clostridia bacterium]|nr:LicD family protein [Clostridia bacterium]